MPHERIRVRTAQVLWSFFHQNTLNIVKKYRTFSSSSVHCLLCPHKTSFYHDTIRIPAAKRILNSRRNELVQKPHSSLRNDHLIFLNTLGQRILVAGCGNYIEP